MKNLTNYYAYCDGACSGNPGPAGWGVLLEDGDGLCLELSGYLGQGTNQVAELVAAIVALRNVPSGASVNLHSDSKYVITGLSEWVQSWESRGWRTAGGKPVANLELWKALRSLERARQVTLTWVKGHAGHPKNERVDALATDAVARGRKGVMPTEPATEFETQRTPQQSALL